MITLKAILLGIGFSVFGTAAYLVLDFWWFARIGRQSLPAGSTGQIGVDIISLAQNTILAPAYWLLVLGLFATGCAIVFLWPGPVVTP